MGKYKNEMVERVTKAIFAEGDTWTMGAARDAAIAAILAMREPTGDMIEAGDENYVEPVTVNGGLSFTGSPSARTWRAMIDEALE